MIRYIEQTKTLAFSLVAILPLIVLYEYFIPQFHEIQFIELRNTSELLIKNFLGFAGLSEWWHYGLIYLFFTVMILVRSRRIHQSFPGPVYIGGFFLECVTYAVIFGFVTKFITGFLLSLQTLANAQTERYLPQFLFAIAAGVYEEILFRLLFLGSLLILFNALLPSKRAVQIAFAVLISATVFSLYHYPNIDVFEWSSFTYRFIAGVILSLLYVFRGLAVSVYTHALYNVFLLLREG